MYILDKISIKPACRLRSKTFSALLALLLLQTQQLLAQITDDFSDGDFTTNPAWNGSPGHFFVNASSQLQLNNSTAGTSYLSTGFQTPAIDDFEWEFYLKQAFAPSASNFGRFYLLSDESDLSVPLNGYYLQFGEAGSNDAVELFRQSGSVRTSVCRATPAAIAAAFEARVKVNRNHSGLWQLYIDYAGGNNFVLEASGTDATYSASAYCGIFCNYTVTNSTRFYYDDISVHALDVPDTLAPGILSVEVVSSTELKISFSEPLNDGTARDRSNYIVIPTFGNPSAVELPNDQRTVYLTFPTAFTNGVELTLAIKDVTDTAGNKMISVDKQFLYFKKEATIFRDLVVTEIFPDPSPQVGLPPFEFVEVYNRSSNPVQLDGWVLTDGASTGMLPDRILLPDNYLILCPSNSLSQFTTFGQAISVSNFPTLNNSSDKLVLLDEQETTIDSVHYNDSWYGDEDKQAGGWTLERIDPENDCETKNNWHACVNLSGGTPGLKNSVYKIIEDKIGPELTKAILLTPSVIQLRFSEKLNSSPPATDDFLIEPFVNIADISFGDLSLTNVNIKLFQNIDTTISYQITAGDIYDCPGNLIGPDHKTIYLRPDTIPPFISILQATAYEIVIVFSEKISALKAEAVTSYFISDIGNPKSAALKEDQTTVSLLFDRPFDNGKSLFISINDIADLSGNLISAKKQFMYFQSVPASFKDIIVTEIFADPSPPIGLPEAEFIEIYNRSEHPFNVAGWAVSDGNTSGTLPYFMLLPSQYLILTSSNAGSLFSSFGDVLSASGFPGLNNSGDALVVKDPHGTTIDSVKYDPGWYRNDEKKDGGWSLELIDLENICAEASNWTASDAEPGGTPGAQNSVNANNPDNTGPRLLSVLPISPDTLLLVFDEKLDRVQSVDQFIIDPTLNVQSVFFADGALTSLMLALSNQAKPSVKYTLTVANIYDCPGNQVMSDFSTASFVLPEAASSGDIVINEILFDPRFGGVDFVEIYNRSQKTINLQNWSLGNLSNDSVENAKIISDEIFLIPPHEFRVFTENTNILKGEYLAGIESNFVEVNLPVLNDDEGSIAIVNAKDTIMDSFQYASKMHAVFLKDPEGVSLERISVDASANDSQNWRSASSTSGFATPGYFNSNARPNVFLDDESVKVEPEIFQPFVNNLDFTKIQYRFERGGLVANVKIFDQQGRAVKEVAHSQLLGTEGFFRWDGDRDNGGRARTGYYLVWFEVFDEDGMLKTYRKKVAIY